VGQLVHKDALGQMQPGRFGENENKSDKRVGQKHGRDEMGYRISFQEFEF
jgi:hypothetical protein